MSHFVVYVFTKDNGKDVDELLALYDESIEYAPYIQYTKEQAIKKVRKEIEDYKHSCYYTEYLADPAAYKAKHNNTDHINYLENEFPKKLNWTDDECYEYQKQWYESEMIDEDGNLLSTYNPNSKWDWYSIGGRWSGGLITKNGDHVDEAYVNEVDWDQTGIPFAFVTPIGMWKEKEKWAGGLWYQMKKTKMIGKQSLKECSVILEMTHVLHWLIVTFKGGINYEI